MNDTEYLIRCPICRAWVDPSVRCGKPDCVMGVPACAIFTRSYPNGVLVIEVRDVK